MKVFVRLLLFVFMLCIGNTVKADTFKVLVLPVDLFSVCENYYCFPEMSEIFANDLIFELNKTNKILLPDLYSVRKKFNDVPALKQTAIFAFNRYKNDEVVDFYALKKLAQAFNVKSIILISSMIVQDDLKRNLWEVLEISSAFDLISQYDLKTNIVLTDNVNNVVMWSGKHVITLGDNECRFWAKNFSYAVSHLEKLRAYSKEIFVPMMVQNIILRFYPKVMKPVNASANKIKTEITDFKPNPLDTQNINKSLFKENSDADIEGDVIYSF